ncbi:hypothetical protein B0H13DRAFT_1899921 [Mycena leptocephala]|nr:hypothetical protein B0H13DRAFT_1899921 [Mycena leptocephala]
MGAWSWNNTLEGGDSEYQLVRHAARPSCDESQVSWPCTTGDVPSQFLPLTYSRVQLAVILLPKCCLSASQARTGTLAAILFKAHPTLSSIVAEVCFLHRDTKTRSKSLLNVPAKNLTTARERCARRVLVLAERVRQPVRIAEHDRHAGCGGTGARLREASRTVTMDTDREGRDRVYAACRSAKLSSGQDVEHLLRAPHVGGGLSRLPAKANGSRGSTRGVRIGAGELRGRRIDLDPLPTLS